MVNSSSSRLSDDSSRFSERNIEENISTRPHHETREEPRIGLLKVEFNKSLLQKLSQVRNEDIKRIRISQDLGGHDGMANGGRFGVYKEIFGLFPEGALKLAKDNAPIEEFKTKGRLTFARTKFDHDFEIDKTLLQPGDFIALETLCNSQVNISFGGEIDILAHKLPVGEVPFDWEEIGGRVEDRRNGYYENEEWSMYSRSELKKVSMSEVSDNLGLIEIKHPYGSLWLDGQIPVAVSMMPVWNSGGDVSHIDKRIMGSKEYWDKKGYAIYSDGVSNSPYSRFNRQGIDD